MNNLNTSPQDSEARSFLWTTTRARRVSFFNMFRIFRQNPIRFSRTRLIFRKIRELSVIEYYFFNMLLNLVIYIHRSTEAYAQHLPSPWASSRSLWSNTRGNMQVTNWVPRLEKGNMTPKALQKMTGYPDRECPNFTGLVLYCIEAKFCKKICVWKLSPRSTQCTPLHSSKSTFFSKNC